MGKFFIAMYAVTSAYFACLMIRLMLVFVPSACMLAAIGVSENWRDAAKSIRVYLTEGFESSQSAIWGWAEHNESVEVRSTFQNKKKNKRIPVDVAVLCFVFMVPYLKL